MSTEKKRKCRVGKRVISQLESKRVDKEWQNESESEREREREREISYVKYHILTKSLVIIGIFPDIRIHLVLST